VGTWRTFFSLQEAENRKPYFIRPRFIEDFFLYYGVDSPSVDRTVHFFTPYINIYYTHTNVKVKVKVKIHPLTRHKFPEEG